MLAHHDLVAGLAILNYKIIAPALEHCPDRFITALQPYDIDKAEFIKWHARAIPDRVEAVARREDIGVAPGAAVKLVVTGSANKNIFAVNTNQGVIAAIAVDTVTQRRADEIVVAPVATAEKETAGDQVFGAQHRAIGQLEARHRTRCHWIERVELREIDAITIAANIERRHPAVVAQAQVFDADAIAKDDPVGVAGQAAARRY